ncbi:MAG: hypothetical protein WA717_04300, partial [Methyloceanibacter sp.]
MTRQVAESLANTPAGMFSTMLVRNASLCPGAELRWGAGAPNAYWRFAQCGAARPSCSLACALPPNPGGPCTRSGYGLFALTRS